MDLTVQLPVVDIVDVYDPVQLNPEDTAADSCLSTVTDNRNQTTLVIEGRNFGGNGSLLAVALVSIDGMEAHACDVCFIEPVNQRLARCVTRASRTQGYNLTVEVVGQVSIPVLYDYQSLVQVGAPRPPRRPRTVTTPSPHRISSESAASLFSGALR